MDHGFGFFGMSVFWILFVVVLAFVVSSFLKKDGRDDSICAVEIVKNRFARGEITKDEMKQLLQDLK